MDAGKIESLIEDTLAPLVVADGGQLYWVALSRGVLHLHLTGRFSGCPGNTLVERRVFEPLLRAAEPDLKLKLTAGASLPEGARPLGGASAGAPA